MPSRLDSRCSQHGRFLCDILFTQLPVEMRPQVPQRRPNPVLVEDDWELSPTDPPPTYV